jgi:hypothetical protein
MLKQPIYSRRVLLYLIISFSPVYLIDAGEEKNKFPEKLFKLLLLLPCVLYVDCWKGGSRAAERTLKTLSVILFLPIGYIYIFRDFWNMPSGCRPGVRSWFSSSFPPSSLQERKTGFSLIFFIFIRSFLLILFPTHLARRWNNREQQEEKKWPGGPSGSLAAPFSLSISDDDNDEKSRPTPLYPAQDHRNDVKEGGRWW